MRRSRLGHLFLAFYLTFIGGGAYYAILFPIRVAHHIIMTALAVLWLIHRARSGKGIPRTALNIPIVMALVIWFAAAIFSLDPRMSLEHIWILLLHVLIFFYLADLFQSGNQRLVFEIIFFMGFVVILLSLIELLSGFLGLGITPGTSIGWIVVGRLPGFREIPPLSMALSVSTLQAGYLAPLTFISAGWAATVSRKDYRVALWVNTALLFACLLLTFSRGGLLSILSAVGVWLVFQAARSPRITRILAPRWILAGSAAAGAIFLMIYIYLTLPLGIGASNDQRLDMYQSAVEITLSDPLTGVGPGLFGRAFRAARDPFIAQDKLASAHNLYLNTASETGIPGMLVGLLCIGILGYAGFSNWQRSENEGHRKRLEFVAAALIGIGVHSLVDVFSITPIVLLLLALCAYLVTPLPRSRLQQPQAGNRKLAFALLILVVVYGILFIPIDTAQGRYMNALAAQEIPAALESLHTARQYDPLLHLYVLQEAVITGYGSDTEAAVVLYEQALELEPTWDIGWINIGLLYEKQGRYSDALAAFERAVQIDRRNAEARYNWARVAEAHQLASESQIVDAYYDSFSLNGRRDLPLNEFWLQSPLRLEAVRRYTETLPVDLQYRIYEYLDPDQAISLVLDNPSDAAGWWVLGQHHLTVEDDPRGAVDAFQQALRLAPRSGDYALSLARAWLENDSDQARTYWQIAQVLDTKYEYPHLVEIALQEDSEHAEKLLLNGLPLRNVRQEFAATLYQRPAALIVHPDGWFPLIPAALIDPVIARAETAISSGSADQACGILDTFLTRVPYDSSGQRLWENHCGS